jgi:hypothetical protein
MAILQSPVGSHFLQYLYIRVDFLSTVSDQNCCISLDRYPILFLDEERGLSG